MKIKLTGYIVSTVLISLFFSFIFSSCKTKGCTDANANNYNYDANKNDGSCDYGGCTDRNALNYNPLAEYNNGTCNYLGGVHLITNRTSIGSQNKVLVVYVNSQYVGTLKNKCTLTPSTCQSNCDYIAFTDKKPGNYILNFFEIQIKSASQLDTIYSSNTIPFYLPENKCITYTIE